MAVQIDAANVSSIPDQRTNVRDTNLKIASSHKHYLLLPNGLGAK
jgi:hypothetical protein